MIEKMSYAKIYYNDINEIDRKASEKCEKWLENVSSIYDRIEDIVESKTFEGDGAKSLKSYLKEVHGTLIGSMINLIYAYFSQLKKYNDGFIHYVDFGDNTGKGSGVIYTTIVADEIADNMSIPLKIDKLILRTEEICDEANRICNSVSDLLTGYFPRADAHDVIDTLNNAKNCALELDKRANIYEDSHKNDFDEIDMLIMEVNRILDMQLSSARIPAGDYNSGYIGHMCDCGNILKGIKGCEKICENFKRSDYYEEALNLVSSRDQMLLEKQKYDRRWVKWLETGVELVASATLIICTAGAATPVVCMAVGAVGKAATVAVNILGDNYYEKGSWTEGVNWSEFGKNVTVGAASGAVSGWFGASKYKNAANTLSKKIGLSIVKNTGATVAGDAVEIVWDIGDAVIHGKGADKVMSILEKDGKKMLKDTIKSTVTSIKSGITEYDKIGSAFEQPASRALKIGMASFSESFVNGSVDLIFEAAEKGSFDEFISCLDEGFGNVIKNSVASGSSEYIGKYLETYFGLEPGKKGFDKSLLRKIGEGSLTGLAKAGAKGTITILWDLGDIYLGGGSLNNTTGVLEKSYKEFVKDIIKSQTDAVAEGINDNLSVSKLFNGTYSKTIADALAKSTVDTAMDTLSVFANSAIEQGVDAYIEGGQFKIDFDKVWEDFKKEYLDEAKIVSDIIKENMEEELKAAIADNFKRKLINPETGEVVRSENGKIVYASQNYKLYNTLVMKDHDNDGMVEIVTFGESESIGVLKEDYDKAVAEAGKGVFKDKTVQEMLGLAHDVSVSEKDILVKKYNIENISKTNIKIKSQSETKSIFAKTKNIIQSAAPQYSIP